VFNTDKKIKIPKEFTLLGHKYLVVLEPDLFEKENCYGNADEDLKLIKIQTPGIVSRKHIEDGIEIEVKVNITEEMVIETFFHEMSHIIFDATGEEELSENERLVNMMGKCMLEIYLSSVYEKDSK